MKLKKYAIVLAVLLLAAGAARADIFGTGGNTFEIDFVPITGDASSANGTNIGGTVPGFVDPDDFLIGQYEITAGQWNKFIAEAGAPTGSPLSAYNATTGGSGLTAGANICALEAFQFVNWLNTSTGNQAAYKFIETTPGDPSTLTFALWDAADADGTNLFRHKDAWYFLPTEDEWVKAGYWNGTTLQLHSTTDNHVPVKQVDGNFSSFGTGILPVGTFPVELNGTYNMIGNLREITESPNVRWVYDPNPSLSTGVRGAAYTSAEKTLIERANLGMGNEQYNAGIRVASEIPEPATMSLLVLGGLAMLKRRRP